MRVQHFPSSRTFSLRATIEAFKQVIRFGWPYRLEVVGLAYESGTNAELDNEWYMINKDPHILYSRRFVEQNYEEDEE